MKALSSCFYVIGHCGILQDRGAAKSPEIITRNDETCQSLTLHGSWMVQILILKLNCLANLPKNAVAFQSANTSCP